MQVLGQCPMLKKRDSKNISSEFEKDGSTEKNSARHDGNRASPQGSKGGNETHLKASGVLDRRDDHCKCLRTLLPFWVKGNCQESCVSQRFPRDSILSMDDDSGLVGRT